MVGVIKNAIKKIAGGPGGFDRPGSLAALPVVSAHGAGVAGYDEIFIFGGIGLVVAVLIFLSWRAGRKREEEMRRRRRRR